MGKEVQAGIHDLVSASPRIQELLGKADHQAENRRREWEEQQRRSFHTRGRP